MKQKGVKVFFSVVLAIVLVCGTVAVVKTVKNGGKNPFVKEPATKQEEKIETPAENETSEAPVETPTPAKAQSVRFVSVGDNLIHDGIYEQAAGRANKKGYDFSFCYSRVKPIIEKADIATINQETIVAKSFPPSGYPMFNSPEELGKEVVNTGFDIVNLANNHMLDKGAKGLKEAVEFWRAQEGISVTGAYLNEKERDSIEIRECNGIKIGLVGITQYLNGLSLPKDSPMKIILTTDQKTIENKIKKAKAQCDVVLVNVHWGTEYSTTPTQDQKNLAKNMADWGADIIIGHHPHVLQPVTWIDRADGGRTLCVYSLGNFISQQNTAPRVIGGMLHYTVEKDATSGKVTVKDVLFEPTITHWVPNAHDVQIYPLSAYSDELAKKQASRIKQPDFSIAYINEFVKKIVPEEFLKKA